MEELTEKVLQFGCCQVFSSYRLRPTFPINWQWPYFHNPCIESAAVCRKLATDLISGHCIWFLFTLLCFMVFSTQLTSRFQRKYFTGLSIQWTKSKSGSVLVLCMHDKKIKLCIAFQSTRLSFSRRTQKSKEYQNMLGIKLNLPGLLSVQSV